MYSDLHVSKLAMHRSMGWLKPKRRLRVHVQYFYLNVRKLAMKRSMGWLSPRRRQDRSSKCPVQAPVDTHTVSLLRQRKVSQDCQIGDEKHGINVQYFCG
jgi:hypothetical protein